MTFSTGRAEAGEVGSVIESPQQRVKILLVDDQPDNLLSAEAVLESLGQEIVKARSGREALRHLLDEDFALILLDVMMPGMDGFETAALIRQRERSRQTPIIFLTALGKSEEYLFQGYEVGAVDYLFKPIIPEVLRSKAAVFVELHRKTLALQRHSELLQQRNAQLEEADREIHRLNRHLERRVEELGMLNRELEAFSYSVSHDLRAPLNRIAGFSQALLESYAEKLDGAGKVYLERVHNSARRMNELVDDLLNFSRVTRGEMRREDVNLSALATSIAFEIRTREPSRQAEFAITDDLHAWGDPSLLRTALLNLLENAWKFTRRQPDACIEFGARVENGALVYFVRDNGAGFDGSQADKLFTPFQRLHKVTEFEGTGIGLATVDRIIRRHGGRIWANGEIGRGAIFSFTLQAEA